MRTRIGFAILFFRRGVLRFVGDCLLSRNLHFVIHAEATKMRFVDFRFSLIPLLFSIADGIAIGFITYFAIKIFTGQWQKLTPAAWLMTGLFITKFVYM